MILILPAAALEGSGVYRWLATTPSLGYPLAVLLGSGVIAFSLNYSIFYVIQTTSALTFNVAGNMKTAVAIACSWCVPAPTSPSTLYCIGC